MIQEEFGRLVPIAPKPEQHPDKLLIASLMYRALSVEVQSTIPQVSPKEYVHRNLRNVKGRYRDNEFSVGLRNCSLYAAGQSVSFRQVNASKIDTDLRAAYFSFIDVREVASQKDVPMALIVSPPSPGPRKADLFKEAKHVTNYLVVDFVLTTEIGQLSSKWTKVLQDRLAL